MASEKDPVVLDHDNPEWTEKDFALAVPITDFPDLAAAFPSGAKRSGQPAGSSDIE